MANNCTYEMKVISKSAESIKTLYSIMNYEEEKDPRWMARIFSCDGGDEILSYKGRDGCIYYDSTFYGDVAWSLHSTMFEGGYFKDMHDPKQQNSYSAETLTNLPFMRTLPMLCKELNLVCELYSEEAGCEFAEHYIINNCGEITENECVDFQELFVDPEEYDSLEAMNKDCGTDFTEDEYNEDTGTYRRGGFEDTSFGISPTDFEEESEEK